MLFKLTPIPWKSETELLLLLRVLLLFPLLKLVPRLIIPLFPEVPEMLLLDIDRFAVDTKDGVAALIADVDAMETMLADEEVMFELLLLLCIGVYADKSQWVLPVLFCRFIAELLLVAGVKVDTELEDDKLDNCFRPETSFPVGNALCEVP